MKLSVLIPVYNRSVSSLLNDLLQQVEQSSEEIEIICLDDGSDLYVKENKETASRLNITYYFRENRGRAISRNQLMKLASGEYLLFLDCDSGIISQEYINNYLLHIQNLQPKVLYGGRVYPEKAIGNGFKLHWKYGKKVEAAPLEKRLKSPHLTFMSNNFVVKKEVLMEFPMDEKLENYGYEDLLWSLDLEQNGISIQHCYNPVIHEDLCSSRIFLAKTMQALTNLSFLVKEGKIATRSTPLLKTYDQLVRLRLIYLFTLFFSVCKNIISHQLKGKYPILTLFSIWKLGHYAEIMKKKALVNKKNSKH